MSLPPTVGDGHLQPVRSGDREKSTGWGFQNFPHRLLFTELPKCAEKASALLFSLQKLEEQEVVVRVLSGETGTSSIEEI